jgi:prevent-host-death family protein
LLGNAELRHARQRASEVLRMAERGETFEVTDRGRAVALITPIRSTNPLDQMRAAGDLSTPTGAIADLPAPLSLPPRTVAPSLVLARLRADER